MHAENPSCFLCPVQRHCRAFAEGVETELPVKTKGKAPKRVSFRAIVLMNEKGNILIQNARLVDYWRIYGNSQMMNMLQHETMNPL